MLRFIVHYGIHFLVPIAVGCLFFRKQGLQAILILLAGILIDMDHLWSDPIFDSERCSIGLHFFHRYWAITVYIGLLFFQKTRIYGIAFLIHIFADITDCYMMTLP